MPESSEQLEPPLKVGDLVQCYIADYVAGDNVYVVTCVSVDHAGDVLVDVTSTTSGMSMSFMLDDLVRPSAVDLLAKIAEDPK